MTNSAHGVRLGAEFPQIVVPPPDIASTHIADLTIELANRYAICDGNPLSPSQELRLRNGMAERADGSWAAARVGDFGGRQGAGKTDTVIARILGGILLVDERLIIYTAHEYPTANEVFIRMRGIFEAYDDLARLVVHERKAHGDQGFELTNGRRILFKTRTGKSGRGFAKADLIVYDEAQHLTPEHVAGSGPAKLANPNSQAWWSGSGGLSTSHKAHEMRRQALLGTGGRLSYTEHTAELVEVVDGEIRSTRPDPDDVDAWYRANPGLGRWVTEEGMYDLRHELGDLFAREGLCVWEPEAGSSHGSAIPMDEWNGLAQVSQIESSRSWALAVSSARDWAALGVAGLRADGRVHVEWMEHRSGTSWVLDRVEEAWRARGIPIRIHAQGPEAAYVADLRARGVEVVEVSSAEYARASGALLAAVADRRLVHLGQPALTEAVNRATLHASSSGAVSFVEGSGEITTLKAVTVAFGGVLSDGAPRVAPMFALT